MLTGQRHYRHLTALLIAISVIASCEPSNTAREPLDVHVGGRAVVAADNPLRHTYNWPGVYFEARFSGPSVTVEIDDDQNILKLLVDGETQLVFPRAGRRSVTLQDLGDGEHTIRLEKLTETQGPTGDFLGFFVPDIDAVLPPPQYDRLIEFIGDSNTVGYGNTSTGRECTDEQISDTTNTSLAFAPLVARHFDADYRIIASSGYGMVRNYANGSPGKTMPVLHERALHDDPNSAVVNEQSPDDIVIALGSNDFSTPLGEDEAWEDDDKLREDFRDTYVRFIERLRHQHASARFVLVALPDFAADVEAVRDTLIARGIDQIIIARLSALGLDRLGCDYHLSVSDHAQFASNFINSLSEAE